MFKKVVVLSEVSRVTLNEVKGFLYSQNPDKKKVTDDDAICYSLNLAKVELCQKK